MKALRKAAKIFAVFCIILAMLVLALLVAGGLQPVLNWASSFAARQVEESLGLKLEIESLSGNLFRHMEINNISLSDEEDGLVVIPHLSFSVSLSDLIWGRITLDDLNISAPTINLTPGLISLSENGGQADSGESTTSFPNFGLNRFNLEEATLNIKLPGLEDYSLSQVNISGNMRLGGNSARLELKDASALWQKNGNQAFAAQGAARLNKNALLFNAFSLELNGNTLNIDGQLNWHKTSLSSLKLDANFGHDLPAPLSISAPPLPISLSAQVTGADNHWLAQMAVSQAQSSIRLNGTIDQESLLAEFAGRADEFYVENLGVALPEIIKGLNINGALKAAVSPHSLDLQIDGINIDQARLGSIDAAIAWDEISLQIKNFELKQAEGSLQLSARLKQPLLANESDIKVNLRNFSVPRRLAVPDILEQALFEGEISVNGSPDSGTFKADFSKIQPDSQLAPATLKLDGAWQDGYLTITEGDFNAPWGNARLSGTAGVDALDLTLAFNFPEIKPVLAILPLPEGLPNTGALNGRVKAGGSPERPNLNIDITGSKLSGESININAASIQADLSLTRPVSAHGSINISQLSAGGITASQLLLQADINNGQGLVRLDTTTTGDWRLNLEMLPSAIDLSAWELRAINIRGPQKQNWQQAGSAAFSMANSAPSLANLRLNSGRQQIAADFSLKDNLLNGALNITRLDINQIVGGNNQTANPLLTLEARLNGSLDNPLAEFTGLIIAEEAGGLEMTFNGGYKNQQASLRGQGLLDGMPIFDLNASGLVTLEGNIKNLRAQAIARHLDLKLLESFIPDTGNLRGVLDMDISLSGSWPNLEPQGFIKVADAGFSVNSLNTSFRGVNIWLECAHDGILVKEFTMRSGRGKTEITGRAGWPWLADAVYDLQLTQRDFSFKIPPWGYVVMDVDASLKGNHATPVLTADITCSSAQAQIFRTSHSDLDEIVLLESGQTPPPLAFEEPEPINFTLPDFFAPWHITASMAMAPDFRINLHQGWLNVSGRVVVHKPPFSDPQFSGGYNIDGGIMIIMGTRIEAMSGTIEFNDPNSFLPDLNMQASVRRGFTNITARITGNAGAPVMSLTSDPPMSQADILSMLAFGKPVQELSQQEGTNLSNQAMALAVIGERGRQELQNVLGPTFAPDIITVHTERQFGSSIEAGKYLTKSLYLRYRQGTDNSENRSLGLEWRITPRISLQGQLGTMRDSGIDIIFHFIFQKAEDDS